MVLSCVKGFSDGAGQSEPDGLQTIYASQHKDSETKNVIDDNSAEITWTSGDAINVFFGSSLNSKFVTSQEGEIAQFKG